MKLNEPDIQKLYMRLQALEADRESLKHEIMSMRTDKAQLVLLREIAQNLCRDAANLGPVPERRIVKSQALFRGLSIISLCKWIASFVFWRREASHSKYTFGLSHNNAGLLIVLDKYPSMRQWRCLTKLHPRLESTVSNIDGGGGKRNTPEPNKCFGQQSCVVVCVWCSWNE